MKWYNKHLTLHYMTLCRQGCYEKYPYITAQTFYQRARGLSYTSKKSLQPLKERNISILFERCNSLHSFGMAETLDIALFDQNHQCVKSVRKLKPYRCIYDRTAQYALERISSSLPWIEVGQHVKCEREVRNT